MIILTIIMSVIITPINNNSDDNGSNYSNDNYKDGITNRSSMPWNTKHLQFCILILLNWFNWFMLNDRWIYAIMDLFMNRLSLYHKSSTTVVYHFFLLQEGHHQTCFAGSWDQENFPRKSNYSTFCDSFAAASNPNTMS